jgi:hypothetical protein
MVHLAWDGEPPRFSQECRRRAFAHPRLVLLAAFSRSLSRCYPLLYRPAVLRLLCADETSDTRWTICVLSCTCRHCAGKRQETVDVQVATTHMCQALLLPGYHRISIVGKAPGPLRFLLSTLLISMKKNATDRFMRDTISCCYGAQGFLLLHHTMNDQRPMFSGNTIFGMFWPWSPFANYRRGLTSCASS